MTFPAHASGAEAGLYSPPDSKFRFTVSRKARENLFIFNTQENEVASTTAVNLGR